MIRIIGLGPFSTSNSPHRPTHRLSHDLDPSDQPPINFIVENPLRQICFVEGDFLILFWGRGSPGFFIEGSSGYFSRGRPVPTKWNNITECVYWNNYYILCLSGFKLGSSSCGPLLREDGCIRDYNFVHKILPYFLKDLSYYKSKLSPMAKSKKRICWQGSSSAITQRH